MDKKIHTFDNTKNIKKSSKMKKQKAISFRLNENLKEKAERISEEMYGEINLSKLMTNLISDLKFSKNEEQFNLCYKALDELTREKNIDKKTIKELIELKNEYDFFNLQKNMMQEAFDRIEVRCNSLESKLIKSVNSVIDRGFQQ